jgi:hypothetical protein
LIESTAAAEGAQAEPKYINNPNCEKGLTVNMEDRRAVYVSAIYWVITTLTTVGYGDYKGYT